MSRVSIDETILTSTADAIRAKGGTDELMSPTAFASAITAIPTMDVTIDKTLTQEDQAAEAKATGDRIAEEATARAEADTALQQGIADEIAARTSAVSAEITNRESGDTLLQTQINQIIAPSGEAPSAAEVENARIDVNGVSHATLGEAIREQVGDLKSSLSEITGVSEISEWVVGKYYGTGNYSYIEPFAPTGDASSYKCVCLACQPGDVFYLTGQASIGARPYAFLSAAQSSNVIRRGDASVYSKEKIVAPQNAAYAVFNIDTRYPPYQLLAGEFLPEQIENLVTKDEVKAANGLLFTYVGTFTATETLQTDFILQPHTTYLVKFNTARTNTINVFGSGYTSSYKRANPWNDTVLFTNDGVKRYLSFYNPNGQLDTVNVTVFVPDSIAEKATDVPTVYRVTKTAVNGNYTSLSKCLYDLKDDNRPKIIEIWEGDYDIYSEYKELYDAGLLDVYTGNDPSMDYFPYCVWVPKNTHIIGKGIVRLKWMPDPSEVSITAVQCRCISPLNVAASCTIENVEVYCKNGRYCLHNDGLGKTEFTGAVQKYINCRFYKYPNDTEESSGLTYGFLPTTGFGIDRAMHHVYENCVFVNYASERAFYGHSRAAAVSGEKQSSDITLVNCVIDTDADRCIKFGNSASNRNIHIRTMFNGCYISGNVVSQREASGGLDCANGFDMQFLNCGDVSVNINDPDNPYPPKSYNTNLTIIS